MIATSHDWVATAPVGAAALLAEELTQLGAERVKERDTDVRFHGPLELGYRACLWSRTAARVYLSLGVLDVSSADALYQTARGIDWREHLAPGATLSCDCSGRNDAIRNSLFGAQRLKDAVCDSLRDSTGERPNIEGSRPSVRLHLHIERARGWLSIDFAGASLHERGYRRDSQRAPLKENLAAALLLRCGWPSIFSAGGALIDPMCGSGTLLIEAALMCADRAPALRREYFGFVGWRGYDPVLWQGLRAEAKLRAERGAAAARRIITGWDADAAAVAASLTNAHSAGVQGWIHVERRPIDERAPAPAESGLVIVNPPYGERMGEESQVREAYVQLGARLREDFSAWSAGVLTGNLPLARAMGALATRSHRFKNGSIDCRLLRFDRAASARSAAPADWSARPGAQMFANRLRKNLRARRTWAKANGIHAYRVYDADMPEYAFAIDCYSVPDEHWMVQEYRAPKTVAPQAARDRRREALAVLPQVFAPGAHIHLRERRPQKRDSQYTPLARRSDRHTVIEGGVRFLVNFDDYLDTGLFLEQRGTRALIKSRARGKSFLNLFCYTGSANVYAAAGGATRTVGVDASNTYLEWARANLELNECDRLRNELHRADCLDWLEAAAGSEHFDLIYLDPPTFSNSHRTSHVWDVQRDHVGLIRRAARLLSSGGELIFSTHAERFALDRPSLEPLQIESIAASVLPLDFARDAGRFQCYVIKAERTV